MWTAKTDQTRRMPRLIWVFARHTCQFVGFITRQLIYDTRGRFRETATSLTFVSGCACTFEGSQTAHTAKIPFPVNWLTWQSVLCQLGDTKIEPQHIKTSKMFCAPSEDLDHPGHLPSLVRVFAVRMKKPLVRSYPLRAQRRLWSDWADAQADLSLRWVHRSFCWSCHAVAQLLKMLQVASLISQLSDLHGRARTGQNCFRIMWIGGV